MEGKMNNDSKVIVIGVVGHIDPEKIIDFETLLKTLPYFRFIRREVSKDKIWLMKSKGEDAP